MTTTRQGDIMRKRKAGLLVLAALALVLGSAPGGRAAARGDDDDLSVVKKAVSSEPPPPSAPVLQADPPASGDTVRSGGSPRWLKVRVVERGGKGARVTVRLPLQAVKALGDDLPVTISGRREKLRLSEILRSLQAGEPLVEVKDEENTVRIWVE